MTSTACSRGCSALAICVCRVCRNSSGSMTMSPWHWVLHCSSVDIRQNVVPGADNGDQVREGSPSCHQWDHLHIGKTRCPHPHPVCHVQAIADHVVTLLPPGYFRGGIGLSPGDLGPPGD